MKISSCRPKSSYLTITSLVAVFVLPLLAAYGLFFFHDQFPIKKMNTGEILTPPIHGETLGLANQEYEGKWQLLYVKPSPCDRVCMDRIERLKKLHMALGKDQPLMKVRLLPSLEAEAKLAPNTLWVVDPKGFLILYYQAGFQNMKGILEDVKRLLRFSYVR